MTEPDSHNKNSKQAAGISGPEELGRDVAHRDDADDLAVRLDDWQLRTQGKELTSVHVQECVGDKSLTHATHRLRAIPIPHVGAHMLLVLQLLPLLRARRTWSNAYLVRISIACLLVTLGSTVMGAARFRWLTVCALHHCSGATCSALRNCGAHTQTRGHTHTQKTHAEEGQTHAHSF